ncbi:hypothetical protein MKZ38_000391 [Zalerion maritima]|uniref:Uncharacterized protein n=1 Tax=Zalerion maritima TaxID=339359 RepID=A0AAD5WS31_9PEZI|nr:hypothetical protein MKZ38_000391 [Zalerion maritima]
MSGHGGYKRNGSPPSSSGASATAWSPPLPRAGRSSLSALDSRHADAIRREAFSSIYTSSPAAFTSFSSPPQEATGREDSQRKLAGRKEHRRKDSIGEERGVGQDSNNTGKSSYMTNGNRTGIKSGSIRGTKFRLTCDHSVFLSYINPEDERG